MDGGSLAARGSAGIRRLADFSEGDHDDVLLPTRVVIGPDENGFKRTIEYRFDAAGNPVKVTTTTRIRIPAAVRRAKAALERRNWARFGAASDDAASARLTVVSRDEIRLERPRPAGSVKASEGVYVPPKRIPAPYTPEHAGHRGKAALRVRNLSLDADEFDVVKLFRFFGPVRGVSIARDLKTGASKGQAVVNFFRREDAEEAMALNGYGYGHLILNVSFA